MDGDGSSEVLREAAAMAVEYAMAVDDRRVGPEPRALAALAAFDEPLPDAGADALAARCACCTTVGSPATVASTGARYFGFVIGATYPVALGDVVAGRARGTRTPRCR